MSNWAVVENGAALVRVANTSYEPRGAEVVLDVAYCGVCHSDLHFSNGSYNMGGGKTMKLADRGVSLPRVLGHEVVGRVARLGPDARDIAVGDLRVVYPWLGCGHCARCRGGQDNLCTQPQPQPQPQAVGVMRDGGFDDQVTVPHPRFLVDPGNIDPAFAATLACSCITVYSAIRKLMPLGADAMVVRDGISSGSGYQHNAAHDFAGAQVCQRSICLTQRTPVDRHIKPGAGLPQIHQFIADSVKSGGRLVAGGTRVGQLGSFLRPSLVADVPPSASSMRTEPFGPLALANRFTTLEEGLAAANSLPYGLAAYAFTRSAATAMAVSEELQAGGIGINTFAVSQVEAPFGGLKDSGYGQEGGPEGLQAYMHSKYVNHA